MSRVADLLDEAHRVAGRAGYIHVMAVVRRRSNRRDLGTVSALYRKAADMVEEAATFLPVGDGA